MKQKIDVTISLEFDNNDVIKTIKEIRKLINERSDEQLIADFPKMYEIREKLEQYINYCNR